MFGDVVLVTRVQDPGVFMFTYGETNIRVLCTNDENLTDRCSHVLGYPSSFPLFFFIFYFRLKYIKIFTLFKSHFQKVHLNLKNFLDILTQYMFIVLNFSVAT